MKKAFKITIPLVLVIAVLIAAIWFFGFYRPDMTNSFLVSQAENMAEDGRYNRAIRYYTWATKLQPQRDDIYIKLSETYAAADNYTKAEYTLVKAISNQPDMTELYVALCRTYVDQGKLMDAVQMLDRTSSPSVKAELDAMRPAAPTIEPEGGYYTEYIDVSVTSEAGTVYATSDGEYPSSDKDLYSVPITLSTGETTILAIAVDANGMVSPAVLQGYTVGGVVEEVTFADAAIEQTVREQLGLTAEDALMSDLLWSITHLTLPNSVRDLSDLQHFTGLRSLTINDVSGLDLGVLSSLASLQELNLSGCTISSAGLNSIGSLTELTHLTLNGCALTDISTFSQLTKLKEISLSANSLSDVSVLSLMTELERVDTSNNPLTSIAALSACKNLKYLDISDCVITSLGSLSDKTSLETLIASNNQLKTLEELASCRRLSILDVSNNLIKDIGVLADLPALTSFEANHNEISSIPDFDENNCILVHFGVNYNQISDVSGLENIHTLNYLNIDYNKVTNLLPIAKNSTLIKVNAWDNAISAESVDALASYEIILNYNPNYKAPDGE